MEPIPKPSFAFFVDTCLEQQNFIQEIGVSTDKKLEQVDVGELCKLTKERWQNITSQEREAYINGKDREELSKSGGSSREEKKDQYVIRGAKSAYTFFLMEKGEKLKNENPNWELEEVVKELEKRWVEMKDKKRYSDMAVEDRKRYDKEMGVYAALCRESKVEEKVGDEMATIMEDDGALTSKSNHVKEMEVRESKLIESRESRKSVIQTTGAKLKIFKHEKYSPLHSMNDDGEASSSSTQGDSMLLKMKDEQEGHDGISKEKMEHDRKVKMAHDIREKSVRALAEKRKIKHFQEIKQKAIDAREASCKKLAEENNMEDDESDGNFCRYCMIHDCVLHSGFNMSEMIKLELYSIEELELQSMNLVPVEGERYSLTMRTPPSQDLFLKLAVSPLGQTLEELVIQPLEFQHHQIPRPDPYPILSPETLTPDQKFPKLKKLLLEGIAMSRIHIVGENFPVLEDLYIGHPTRDDDFNDFPVHLDVPTLRTIHFRYFSAGEDFAPSLSRSPKLESFRSYKFDFDNVTFVLPSCRILSFYRSDSLSFLSLFAPKLERLNLQGFGIQRLDFLEQIPDKLRRARKFKWKVCGLEYETAAPPSNIVMNCGYGNIPEGSWRTSGRCTVVKEDWSQEFIKW